ncbi:MASE1 domain-containing protein [Jeongeupia chitinilytica]|uniref:Membrane protein n=1 Tax=Jeongeupia chitinilytica TaxID=1041641 RepID=A0ABQ3GWJ3_9NEIS|nr:MASE1 domain-containing protein [Jeongeupia chitinilytica]GHD56899.1 membrane protein [Jeongeupia chitinilytica]
MRMPSLPRLVLFVVVYGLLALFSMSTRDPVTHSTIVWPAAGILLGTLMLAPYRQWPVWALVAVALHTGMALLHDRPLAVSLLLSVINLLIMAGIAGAWRRRVDEPASLTQPASLFWFVLLVLVGCIAGAYVSIAALHGLGFVSGRLNPLVFAISDGVGALIGAPLVIAWAGFHPARSAGAPRRTAWQGLLGFVALIVSAELAFDGPTATMVLESTKYELSYLPLLFVVLIAMAWQRRGMTLALVVLAGIAGLNTYQGEGPFAASAGLLGNPLLEVQLYLGAAALLGLLMAAMNASRDEALREALAWKVRSEGMLIGTRQLMYEVDPRNGNAVWAGPLDELLGLAPADLPTLAAFLERVHPDDRARVAAYAEQRGNGDTGALTQRFRFLTGYNDYVMLQDIGAPVIDFDDTVYRIDGLLRLDEHGVEQG